jgi:BarA-like signal transduction histidine kinase
MTDLSELQKQLYDQLLIDVAKTIAHPHTTIVTHDKLRAYVILDKISNDMFALEYLYSTFTEKEQEQMKLIP